MAADGNHTHEFFEPFGRKGIPEHGVDEVGAIETRGVEEIPDDERHSGPKNLFMLFIALELTFGVAVVGWIPVAFGLGWWSSVTAILVGLAVGNLLLAPMALLGRQTATNGAVSSGAFFGVVGRLIGSALSLLIAIGFYALTVWTAGQAATEALHRLLGTPNSDFILGVSYALVAAVTVLIAVFGHANVLAANRVMIPTAGALMLLGFIAFAPQFDAGYHGGQYLLGSYWPTWILSAVTMGAVAIEYTPFVNDYTRYVSPRRHSARSVMLSVYFGDFIGLAFAFLFGAYVATTFKDPSAAFAPGLADNSPTWYLIPILIISIIGSFGQGGTALYGTGLDFSSLIPFLRRVPATLVLSGIGVVFIYVGTFVFNAVDTVNAFILILVQFTTPWAVICILGYWLRRGYLVPDAVQVFNRGEKGGIYWYWRGINLRSVIPWLVGGGVGMLFCNTSSYIGPFADAFGGVDLSFTLAGVTAGVLYLLLVTLVPEASEVYPDGRRRFTANAAGAPSGEEATNPVVLMESDST